MYIRGCILKKRYFRYFDAIDLTSMSYAVTEPVTGVTDPGRYLGSISGIFRPATRIKSRKVKINEKNLHSHGAVWHLAHVAADGAQNQNQLT